MLTYGDREFTWNTGRNLEKITDGSNEYSYTYDENGIRTSKTVNGVTTYYNTKDGVILSQTDGTNTMYFQYDTNGTPLGFIYNGTQYLYLTNIMGDVISITDAQGNEIAQYEYDAWGGIASISSIGNLESGIVLANANPIRYRGYYFDSETGYYYLQSRYYDSSICRFINADVPEIAEISKDIPDGLNLFAYCNNDATNNVDPTGFFVIKRTTLETLLDVVLAICASGIATPMDIAGKAIKKVFGGSRTYKAVSKVVNHLTKGVVPKFKGLFSKFFTKIRTAIWRVTGYYISNKAKGIVCNTANRFINILTRSRFSVQIDMIFCMFSASGWVAMFMDLLDGQFNNRVYI